jgi:hypothetical protein
VFFVDEGRRESGVEGKVMIEREGGGRVEVDVWKKIKM